MITALDTNAAYYFAGIPAYIMVGPNPQGIPTCTVRQIATHDLLAHSTDLHDIAARLMPWWPPAQRPIHHKW
jgi:hypothetical protein